MVSISQSSPLKFLTFMLGLTLCYNSHELHVGLYTLHHTCKVRFSLILDRTSLVDGRNRSTKGAMHHIDSVRLVQLISYFLKS